MTLEILQVDSEGLQPFWNGIVDAFRAVFSTHPFFIPASTFASALDSHTAQPDFCCCLAREENSSQILGFAYGYTAGPGQFWWDSIAERLPPEITATWLSSSFELVQLGVIPAARGRRIANRLHDNLLEALPHQTALLSTRRFQEESAALRMYRARGWMVLSEDFVFPGHTYPYIIMGLDLHRHKTASHPAEP